MPVWLIERPLLGVRILTVSSHGRTGWGALLGFLGLIIALPLTTLLIAYYQRYVTRENEAETEPEQSLPQTQQNQEIKGEAKEDIDRTCKEPSESQRINNQ